MFIEFERNKEEVYEFLSKYFYVFRITKGWKLIPFEKLEEFKKEKYLSQMYFV